MNKRTRFILAAIAVTAISLLLGYLAFNIATADMHLPLGYSDDDRAAMTALVVKVTFTKLAGHVGDEIEWRTQ